jgi:hypothetical protein
MSGGQCGQQTASLQAKNKLKKPLDKYSLVWYNKGVPKRNRKRG